MGGSSWTSFTGDRTLGADTFQLSTAAKEITRGVHILMQWSMVCVHGGPDPSISCNPHSAIYDSKGTAGSWHTGNLTINTTSRSATVAFASGGAFAGHSLVGKVRAEADGYRYKHIDWYGGGRWARINPNQLGDCCAHCVTYGTGKEKKCKGWMVDPSAGTCSLVGTVTTAYPSLATIAGYTLQSDPASYCTSLFGGGGQGSSWADETLAKNTSCGSMQATSMPPSRYNESAHPFPRQWADSTSTNGRGTAWFFYPGQPPQRALPQNLTDLWTSSSCSAGVCQPNGDILQIVSDLMLGSFRITCLAPGPIHHCSASGGIPVRPNQWHSGEGTVDWASRETTLHLDDDAQYSGELCDPSFNTVELAAQHDFQV